MKFYADKFRKIREMRGLTQGDIADALDYKRQAVQRWEQELTSPKARMVPRLAEVLNCSVQDISDMITEEDLTKGNEMIKTANQEKTYAGKVLRAIRKLRGMSAEEIAEKIQANPQTIYGYERGLYQPKMKNTEKLFSLLNVDFHVFEQKILAFPAMAPRELARLIIGENPDSEAEPNDNRNPEKVFEGKVLKSIRLIRGIYGPEVQDKLGISTNSLYDYERGRCFPKAEYADKLFGYLGIDPRKFRQVCAENYRCGGSVEETAQQIMEPEVEKAEINGENAYDEMVIAAVRHGLKNLSAEEKTILFRMIVNFTTQPVKKAYFHE